MWIFVLLNLSFAICVLLNEH